MNALRNLFYILVAAIGMIVPSVVTTSCISDAVSTSSSDLLTFSRDTVSFDTVFTDLGTPTARLVVKNKASKGVVISSIRFKNPDSKFRVNVDGVSGNQFQDVEIRAKDSIYVFLECYIPENDSKEPTLVEDELEFVTNGVTQSVLLEAWGQNVTRLHGVVIESDLTLTDERPYVIFDSLVVKPGAVLTVQPGTKLLFHDKAYMDVQGSLQAVGTVDKKIDMRGDRLDNVLPNVNYDIMAGQWVGVRIAPESFDNRLEFVDMRSTVTGLVLDSCAIDERTKLTLVNSWLHNSQGNVLTAQYCKMQAIGCCFSEAADATVFIAGGIVDFLQCTFANNYLFSSISYPLVTLDHVFEEDNYDNHNPLMVAEFKNCILYGIPDDINIGDLTGSQVFFRYCSLKAAGSDDDNFINCLWDTDPMFYTVRQDYYFNYRLKDDSPVKEAGDPSFVTGQALFDMDGIDRLQYGNPSLGAYQFFAK